MESNYPFTAYWKLFASNGAQVTFGVGSGEMGQHFKDVHAYMKLLEQAGYSVQLPGLEEGDEKYTIDGWVLGETSKEEPCVFLYSPGLKWRVATVYVEKLATLPFTIPDSMGRWMGSAPEREMAEKKKALHTVLPFEIVMAQTGKTNEETGRPYTKFSHVWGNKTAPTVGEQPQAGACPECHAPEGKQHAPSCIRYIKLDADRYATAAGEQPQPGACSECHAPEGKHFRFCSRYVKPTATEEFNAIPSQAAGTVNSQPVGRGKAKPVTPAFIQFAEGVIEWALTLHRGDDEPCSQAQYGYLVGIIDAITGKGSHTAVLSALTGRATDSENRMGRKLASELLDILPETKTVKAADGTKSQVANEKYKPPYVAVVKWLHAEASDIPV